MPGQDEPFRGRPRWRPEWSLPWAGLGVFVLAGVLRFSVVLASSGGFGGNADYDPSVYYTAADALTFGRVPYRDFVLLHPPGLMLVLTPFAALGRLTTDHAGFMIAMGSFELLGAANAALVVALVRRAGLSRRAAAVGGLFYAVWFGAIDAEFTVRLEPLGTTGFLLGLLALAAPRPSRRAVLTGGVALGFAVSVKIWWLVPVAVVLAWALSRPEVRSGWRSLLAGVAAAVAVVDLPFFVAAPASMWRMVVSDQLVRHASTTSSARLSDLAGLHSAFPNWHGAELKVAIVVAALVLAGAALAAWQVPLGRLAVVVLGAQLVVLGLAPTYFSYYSGFVAGPLAVVVGAASQPRLARFDRTRGGVAAVAVTAGAGLTALALGHVSGAVTYFPGPGLAAKTSQVRCIMADSPMALIELNALSRGLADGCPNWGDVSGRTYDVDAAANPSRPANAKWQRDIQHYLLSGDAFMVIRGLTGLSPATKRELESHPVIARSHGFVVYSSR